MVTVFQWAHTLHIFNGIEHVLDHGLHSSLAHNLMLPQLKGSTEQWNDDELHGIGQCVACLVLAAAIHQGSIVCLEVGQEIHQDLQSQKQQQCSDDNEKAVGSCRVDASLRPCMLGHLPLNGFAKV